MHFFVKIVKSEHETKYDDTEGIGNELKKERRKYLDILARGVDADDPLMMGKVEPELAVVGGSALMATDQLVAVETRAFVASFFVGAQLIAETPLLALVAIYQSI